MTCVCVCVIRSMCVNLGFWFTDHRSGVGGGWSTVTRSGQLTLWLLLLSIHPEPCVKKKKKKSAFQSVTEWTTTQTELFMFDFGSEQRCPLGGEVQRSTQRQREEISASLSRGEISCRGEGALRWGTFAQSVPHRPGLVSGVRLSTFTVTQSHVVWNILQLIDAFCL